MLAVLLRAASAHPDVAGLAEEAAPFTGTTGFIKTRPACVPPNYTPDALNYLQGPEPIQQANGDVTLLVERGIAAAAGGTGRVSSP